MTLELMYNLAGPLILMQILAVGWSVNREVHVPDAHKQR